MRGWDYIRPGHYFVTCNTHQSRPLFGVVVNGRMVIAGAGFHPIARCGALPQYSAQHRTHNWNPTQYRMRDNPGSGHCKTAFVLPPGRHEYKFVVNGKWMPDPNGRDSAPDGFGALNSVIHV